MLFFFFFKGSIYLNLDLSTTTFYEPIPLIQYASKVLGCKNPDELKKIFTEKDHKKLEKSRQKLERAIKGVRFRVTHRGEIGSKKKYRARGLTLTPADKTFFDIDINNQ